MASSTQITTALRVAIGVEANRVMARPTFMPSSPPVAWDQRPMISVATSASAMVNRPKYKTEKRPALRPRMKPSTADAAIAARQMTSTGTPSAVRLAAR